MAKVTITNHDPFLYIIRDTEETNELFGEEYINEYGIIIPDNLLKDYKRIMYELWEIQDRIKYYVP